jgi:hypothetical protein
MDFPVWSYLILIIGFQVSYLVYKKNKNKEEFNELYREAYTARLKQHLSEDDED